MVNGKKEEKHHRKGHRSPCGGQSVLPKRRLRICPKSVSHFRVSFDFGATAFFCFFFLFFFMFDYYRSVRNSSIGLHLKFN